MKIDWNAGRILTSLVLCGVAASIAGCGSREPPVVEMLTVSIDADNNCSMENKAIECAQVAAVIQREVSDVETTRRHLPCQGNPLRGGHGSHAVRDCRRLHLRQLRLRQVTTAG